MMTTATQHQIIEASAGTGKTYTIENEVVRLIVDEGVPLTRILIVTFTEKATSELRRRVREKLEAEWRRQPNAPHAAELRASLDTFDDAAIYTIHGFCARVLSEYAFETQLPFTQQQLDDPQIWERLFARSLRGFWRRTILTDDDPLRSRTAFADGFYQGEVQRVAKKLIPGDVLIPAATEPLSMTERTVATHLTTLQQTFGVVPDDVAQSTFILQLSKTKMDGKTAVINLLKTFLPLLQQFQRNGVNETLLDALLSWKPTTTQLERLPNLATDGYCRLEDLTAIHGLLALRTTLTAGVLSHAVQHLAESMRRYKREGGLIDFNDMLLLVQAALQPLSPLVGILRERYAVALVDEFQDTDQVQWDIFRTIFTGDDAHRLIVVGDPKQAIYSFRGANVNVYLAARDDLTAHDAEQRNLDTNWRSYPPLIHALNALFAPASQWFGTGAIQHDAVATPAPERVRARLYADGSARRPLTLVQLRDEMPGGQARIAFARFIAKEIRHQLDSGIEIVEWQGATPYRRPLHPGDICILIQKRPSDLPAIDRALRWADIPYSFPKQGGLFTTQEAQEWRYLLRAIATPDDPRAVMTMLLTRVFACAPEALESYPALPSTHPIKQTLARWHTLAEHRAWAPLFQAIFADTGLLVRELSQENGERTVTNHQHLAQLLHEQAIRTRGSIDDLIAFLDIRCLHGSDDETDLQRIETERRKVQVMTMHSVKGLEFPVVFVAGGFTSGSSNKGYPSYTTPNGRVYAFDKNDEAKRRQAEEADQDNRRLYYVAFTRAKYKLYVPRLVRPKSNSGPMATFIGQAMEQAWPLDTWQGDDQVAYVPVADDGTPILNANAWQAPVDDATGVIPLAMATEAPPIDEARITLPGINPAWGQRVTRVASYSSLADQEAPPTGMPVLQYAPSAESSTTVTRPVDDDATDTSLPNESTDDLPHGAATGTLLHAILEAVEYPAVLAADAPPMLLRDGTTTQACIDRLLDRYPIRRDGARETDRQHIARIVWQTLHTPISFLHDLPLGALTDRRHELEFWLPAPGLRAVTVPDIRLDHTYLSGFIDLVFRHAGRYYILDWKSNWSPSGDYGRATLDTIMREHQYDLQYRIYLVALDRMLRLSVSGYDPSTHLGGVCYLFLRGVGQGDAGIYAVPAEAISIDNTQADILRRLGATMPTTEVRP